MSQQSQRLQQHLESDPDAPENTRSFYCYFGIHVIPPFRPADIQMIGMAAAGRFLAIGDKLNLSSITRSQFENEELQLLDSLDYLGQSEMMPQYKQHFNQELRQFQDSSLPTLRYFNLCFKPTFSEPQIRLLAHNFHAYARQMRSSHEDQLPKLDTEINHLFDSMDAFLNHDPIALEQASAVFWEQARLTKQQVSLNQSAKNQPINDELPDIAGKHFFWIALCIFAALILANIFLIQG